MGFGDLEVVEGELLGVDLEVTGGSLFESFAAGELLHGWRVGCS